MGFPHTDLHVILDGVTLKPGLALGSYAVFKQYGQVTMMTGDLVLLQTEIESVIKALSDSLLTTEAGPSSRRTRTQRGAGQYPSPLTRAYTAITSINRGAAELASFPQALVPESVRTTLSLSSTELSRSGG